jgi:hypothetical protein
MVGLRLGVDFEYPRWLMVTLSRAYEMILVQ